ncbi:hypothetical protein [Sediminicola luteus]|uniref:Uncharacterized protein n=1 Tax=Sediminicola luteus TaxID=319238 RepID=A0A2A4G496_9FLAO|nr:hypothetical protein [Sediminicola luteus]PCE62798.1 hypothetical protein B7P33_16070 [Sediminicola luteus]
MDPQLKGFVLYDLLKVKLQEMTEDMERFQKGLVVLAVVLLVFLFDFMNHNKLIFIGNKVIGTRLENPDFAVDFNNFPSIILIISVILMWFLSKTLGAMREEKENLDELMLLVQEQFPKLLDYGRFKKRIAGYNRLLVNKHYCLTLPLVVLFFGVAKIVARFKLVGDTSLGHFIWGADVVLGLLLALVCFRMLRKS